MLGIFLLYYVWKKFSELALKFDKSKQNGWFGILAYICGIVILMLVLVFLDIILNWNIDWENNLAIKFVEIPFGLIGCYVFYLILEKKWEKEYVKVESIDNIGNSEIEN